MITKEVSEEISNRLAGGETKDSIVKDITNRETISYLNEVIEFKKKLNLNFEEELKTIETIQNGTNQ